LYSTRLTAYVVKVFSMAYNLVAIRKEHICDAVKFLILKAQLPDGMFKETGQIYHGEMIGDVSGSDSDASMTAFCLIAMQESRLICSADILVSSINKAVAYLDKRLPRLQNPYAVAMTSYALANEGKLNREVLYKFYSPELSHWPVPGKDLFTLEATAYALLALVRNKSYDDARPVVRWFNQQQFVGGGYGSTQATIIVYQAVAEYWTKSQEPEYELKVDVLLPGRSKPEKYIFSHNNSYAAGTSRINDINKNVTFKATGSGEAMVSLYYALPEEKESDCQKFNLSVRLLPGSFVCRVVPFPFLSHIIRSFFLYKNSSRNATMSIIDIGLQTGFTPNLGDLKALSGGRARIISKFEMNTALSERGSLIIYLDKVSNTRPEEISFRVQQTMEVGILQPAAVSVYEYYEQTPCVKFYHPEREGGQLMQLCKDDECLCAEENCSMQKNGRISNDERTSKICESTESSKIEYGKTDVGPTGKLLPFLSYPYCRKALNLLKGKTYLVMGSSKDIQRDEKYQIKQYILGERTWIEYWPTADECQGEEHRATCLGLEEMVEQYTMFACQQ
uniref:NTR domain-containing protein n=1 Tax=Oryzias sinensis TaxID=183150 RepID=A0A8C7YH45_9TELE